MDVKIEEWTIKELIKNLDFIEDQPVYQRGKVWSKIKNQLLIDSIFRGIDIPKFYFREVGKNGFKYEVADGQQRIHAIRLFAGGNIKLPSTIINGLDLTFHKGKKIGGKFLSEIKEYENRFYNYKITIAVISNVSNDEIRTLFGRLQEGSTLNPAEKRNAIISKIGTHVDNFVFNHNFFYKCKIPLSRYRHQDYLAHVFAIIFYGNSKPLKASLIEKMYLDKELLVSGDLLKKVSIILDKMEEIDSFSKTKIKNKFSFIDIFYYLYNIESPETVDCCHIAERYDKLEKERKEYKDKLEEIQNLKDKRALYQYIFHYQYAGYEATSITKRYESIKTYLESSK